MLDIVEERAGRSLVLRLRGDVDLASEAVLSAVLRRDVPPDVDEIVIDLSEVGFLDSTGVRVLLEGREHALAGGAVLRLCNPAPVVLRVLRVTSVADLFDLPGP
jgi:anti-sigma B factor antagonist